MCLLKPKWLSFLRFRASGAGCCLGISIADISDIVGWGVVVEVVVLVVMGGCALVGLCV